MLLNRSGFPSWPGKPRRAFQPPAPRVGALSFKPRARTPRRYCCSLPGDSRGRSWTRAVALRMPVFLTIRAVCDELGVTLRTLRFYEAQGLIAPKREPRRRFYYATDVERLRAIMRLKSLGLSIREIREVLQSPGDGPYGLNPNFCEVAFKRLSMQRADANRGAWPCRPCGPTFASRISSIRTQHPRGRPGAKRRGQLDNSCRHRG